MRNWSIFTWITSDLFARKSQNTYRSGLWISGLAPRKVMSFIVSLPTMLAVSSAQVLLDIPCITLALVLTFVLPGYLVDADAESCFTDIKTSAPTVQLLCTILRLWGETYVIGVVMNELLHDP